MASNLLRPDGQPARSGQLQDWLASNLLPAVVAVLLAVLTWNVNQVNAKLDTLTAGQVAGQIQDTRHEADIRANAAATDRNKAEIDDLKRWRDQHVHR